MPPVSSDPKSWEGHLLQMCSRRLSLILTQEQKQFEADSSKPHESLRSKIIDQFKRLSIILSNPGVPPYEFIIKFRKL